MRYLIAFFCSVFLISPCWSNPYDYPITRVIDGDTVEIQANFLPTELKKVLKIRVLGIDTPEKSPKALCPREDQLAKKATEFTQQTINKAKNIQILLFGWDKYGGRVLGDIIVDGKPLSSLLISNGLAREYYGDAKKSWCN